MHSCQHDRQTQQKTGTGAVIFLDLFLACRWSIGITPHTSHKWERDETVLSLCVRPYYGTVWLIYIKSFVWGNHERGGIHIQLHSQGFRHLYTNCNSLFVWFYMVCSVPMDFTRPQANGACCTLSHAVNVCVISMRRGELCLTTFPHSGAIGAAGGKCYLQDRKMWQSFGIRAVTNDNLHYWLIYR